jgi:hypothetical protein
MLLSPRWPRTLLRFLAVAVALLLLGGAAASAKEKPLLAVLDFDVADSGLNSREATALSEDARKVALEVLGDRYDIITRENLVDLLKSHGKTLERCQGECETETGRLIGAELVVTGSVARVFGQYKITVKIHQTDPPKLLGIQDATTTEMNALPGLLYKATKALLEQAAPQPTVQTGRRASRQKKPTKGDDEWEVESGATAFVTFISDPPGAEVWVDGKSYGTPASGKKGVTRRISRGKHEVEMALTLYKPKAKTINVRGARETVELELDPNFAKLTLESSPSGLPVFIDGDEVGKTPIRARRLIAGPHDFRIADRCHFEWTESVTAVPERPVRFSPEMKPKMAAVEVEVKFRGDDVPAVLSVDGKERGPTPGPYKVPLCSKTVKVVPEDGALNSWEHALALEHRKKWSETAEVSDHASIAVAAAEQWAIDEMVERLGWLQIDTSFRMIGTIPGLRSTTSWQPGFWSRRVFVGIDTGWALDDEAGDTAWVETEEGGQREYHAGDYWIGTFNLMAGVQEWYSWGGFFLRGLKGWRWDSQDLGSPVTGEYPSNAVRYGNQVQLSPLGLEVGARLMFPHSNVGLQVSYGRFDDGASWTSVGIVTGLRAGDYTDSNYSDAEFGGAILTVAQMLPFGLVTLMPMMSVAAP